MRRRRLFAMAGAAVAANALNFGVRPADAARVPIDRIVAREVAFDFPTLATGWWEGSERATASVAPLDGDAIRYTSAVVEAGQLFDRVGARWTMQDPALGGSIRIEVRTSADLQAWGDWQDLPHAHDLDDAAAATYYAMPRTVEQPARYAQYRLSQPDGPSLVGSFSLVFLDVTDANAGPLERLASSIRGAFEARARAGSAAAAVGPSKILSRRDWGADESLMRWTPRYLRDHTKAVVHHTVTGDGGTNVAAEIRSIYYFHAVTRGWGDIGYNYLVDKFGNIWQGRQGGEHVEAGHAYGWNNGAFGVAAIGDYSSNPPTSALQGAIANIVAMRFQQYGIQPYGSDFFIHQEQRKDGTWVDVAGTPPNMLGHRDANYIVGATGGQTACPGNTIANMMEGLRRLAQTAVTSGYTTLVRLDPGLPRGTFPGSSLQIPVTVANRGTQPIPTGTGVSYQVYSLRGALVTPQGGRATLPTPVMPGATMTVQVPFTGPAAGEYTVRWDLQNGTAWWNLLYGTPYREQYLRSADWSADWIRDTVPTAFTAGETRVVSATLQNDGGRVWPAGGTNPVVVTYTWTSVATGNQFVGVNKTALGADVQPGQTVSVNIPVTAPLYPTNYTLRLDLEKLNEFKFGDRGIAPDDTSIAVLTDYKAAYQVGTVPALASGQTVTVPVTVTNTGRGILPVTNATPVRLSYHWIDSSGKAVVFEGARTIIPNDLAPGASVSLQAQVTAPSLGGAFTLKFDLVQEGVTWFSAKGAPTADRAVTVQGPVIRTYGAAYQAQATSLAATGAQTGVPITVTNLSNWAWPSGGANPVRLAYHWWSLDLNKTVIWDGMRTLLPSDVAPGAVVNLSGSVQFPTTPGSYLLRWDMVEEGVGWFSGKGVATGDQVVRVTIPKPFTYGASMLPSAPATMPVGATVAVPVRIQDLSTTDWDATVNLSYHWIDSTGKAVVWDGLRTPLAGILAGQLKDVSAQVKVPDVLGTYTLRWDIVREGVAWFSAQGVQMPQSTVKVELPPYGATYAPAAPSIAAAAGSIAALPVTVKNTGSLVWEPGKVNLAYHLYAQSGAVFVWDGQRSALQQRRGTNEVETIAAAIRVPQAPGTYTIKFDLVQEGVTWFSSQGVPVASVTLTVS